MRHDWLDESPYWADKIARQIIREQEIPPGGEVHLEGGITPSGSVHVGNLREVMTLTFVQQALEDLGYTVKTYYVWDDYDRFRKVPKNLPVDMRERLHAELGKPLSEIDDPWACHESLAAHHEAEFEESLNELGIHAEFIRQHEAYAEGRYARLLREAWEKRDIIREILNQYRKEPLQEYIPFDVYCEACGKDTTTIKHVEGDAIHYACACGHEDVRHFTGKGVKAKWRVDWPMRWAYYQIHFEPGGKDHSTPGGSYDTAKQIIKAVWQRSPPSYAPYDFVILKGVGGKMSSSEGKLLTPRQVLHYYTPDVLRFVYASTRPQAEMIIQLDENILQVYEEFDRVERFYYQPHEEKLKDDRWQHWTRVYEMAQPQPPGTLPVQPSFRELTILTQVYEGDIQQVVDAYAERHGLILTPLDRKRVRERAERAYAWVTSEYAPEKYQFRLLPPEAPIMLSPEARAILKTLIPLLESDADEALLREAMQARLKEKGLSAKAFFREAYAFLFNKPYGPRLAGFLRIARERVLPRLKRLEEA